MTDEQSQEVDPKKRMALVARIQTKLEEDAAVPPWVGEWTASRTRGT